mmetsp:Transcript_5048/g.6524  ORF Transcript_5048/g.6524 Transcript_5048/m.6524 type:complete len:149 (-) Transcript_5048:98-544(-)
MKTSVAILALLSASANGFAPTKAGVKVNTALNAEDVPLANGSMSFNRVCREWRCKFEGNKSDSESLEAIAKTVDEFLPQIKSISEGITVNRLVCGGCLDFKLMMTVPLADFGAWEEGGHAPESEFLEKIKAIEGVSQVETQTITNMVL